MATLLGRDAVAGPSHAPSGEVLRPIGVAEIGPNPLQPRAEIGPESLRELAASIAHQGVLQPILVRDAGTVAPRYQIIAGERRWRAAMLAGLNVVPCVVKTLSDSDASMAALVENLQREDLNALEEAEGLLRAQERFGLSQEALAQAVGKSRSHIANTLRLLNLPVPVRDHLRAGTLSAGHARALLGHHDPVAAARVVIARGLNVRQTEALTSAPPLSDQMAPSRRQSERDPDVAALERELTESLGLQVSISARGRAGRVTVSYNTLEQLEGIVALLSHK